MGYVLFALTLAGMFAISSGSSSAGAADAPLSLNNSAGAQASAPQPSQLSMHSATLPYAGNPGAAALAAQSNTATTIQTWSGTVGPAVQNGGFYPFTLVGKNVTVHQSTQTSIKTKVIPIVFTFTSTGDVFDPTVAKTTCGETHSDMYNVLNSPIFKATSFHVGTHNIGTVQFTDALQREEFYQYTNPAGVNPGYHVKLAPTSVPAISVTANGYPVNGSGCGAIGMLRIQDWDSFVQGVLFPMLKAKGVGPTTFPLFVFRNVVLYDNVPGNCCIGGYHSAFNNPSFGGHAQTYGNTDYDTTGRFGSWNQDTSVASHEVSEWMNDPYVNNPTPAWGHIGQVSGCQGNLEVGDPLTGTTFVITISGRHYHVQEEAFFGWFFGYAGGVNGLYSMKGTFTTPSHLCS
jgi:hypothetical protein